MLGVLQDPESLKNLSCRGSRDHSPGGMGEKRGGGEKAEIRQILTMRETSAYILLAGAQAYLRIRFPGGKNEKARRVACSFLVLEATATVPPFPQLYNIVQ